MRDKLPGIGKSDGEKQTADETTESAEHPKVPENIGGEKRSLDDAESAPETKRARVD